MNATLTALEKEIQKEKETASKNEALARIKEMMRSYSGDDRIVSSDSLFDEMGKMKPREKFYTGIKSLDKMMQGFVTGESIFVSGITKHGKTSACLELSVRLKDQNPLWLSFEEKPIELIRKFHERTGEIPHFFTPKQNEKKTLEWVENKIIEAKVKYNSKVVFLDHIGFIKDDEIRPGELEASCYERISRAIHSLATKWDVLFFHLGHLKMVAITQHPDLESIKGSSAMAQEADVTILIWRKTTREGGKIIIGNETNLSIQANRRGGTGNVELIYQDGRFHEIDWERDEEDKGPDGW